MRVRNILIVLSTVLLSAVFLLAQDITATITGTVRDSNGAAVPKAKVAVTNTDKNILVKTVESDENGNFAVPNLEVGHYAVSVEASGFSAFEQRDIDLHTSERYTVNARMRVGGASERVTVEAAAVQVDTQTQQVTGVISGTELRELTLNNRLFEQLVILQPGVSNGSPDQLYVGTTNPFTGAVNC